MEPERTIDEIEAEFQEVRDELKDILFDIRTHLMEVQSPIPNDLENASRQEELKTERG
jgi:hypothetical protein